MRFVILGTHLTLTSGLKLVHLEAKIGDGLATSLKRSSSIKMNPSQKGGLLVVFGLNKAGQFRYTVTVSFRPY